MHKTELQKIMDRVRELGADTQRRAAALRERSAAVELLTHPDPMKLPADVRRKSPDVRKALALIERDKLRDARVRDQQMVKAHVDEAKALVDAPLSRLRALDTAAEQRRESRELVLTEQLLAVARFVPEYTPKLVTYCKGHVNDLLRDQDKVDAHNVNEQRRQLDAEMLNELRTTQHQRRIAAASVGEQVQIARAAAAAGDFALLQTLRAMHAARPLAERAAPITAALLEAVRAIPLPEDVDAELQLLGDVAYAYNELTATARAIATGIEPASARSRAVSAAGDQKPTWPVDVPKLPRWPKRHSSGQRRS